MRLHGTRRGGRLTGGQQPGKDAVAVKVGAGVVDVHRDGAAGEAEALDAGARVAGTDVLVVDGLVLGLELEVERLGLDVLGGDGHGRGQDGGGNSGGLHCGGIVVAVMNGFGVVVVVKLWR